MDSPTPNPMPIVPPAHEDVPPPPPTVPPLPPVTPPTNPTAVPNPTTGPMPGPILPPTSPESPPAAPKKKWGKGALVGSIAAIFLIIASVVTGITLYQRRAEPIATSPKAVDTSPCGSHTVTERIEGNRDRSGLRGIVTNTCADQELKFYIQTFWCSTVDTNPGRLGWCSQNPNPREHIVPPGGQVEYFEEQLVGNNGTCGSSQVDFSYDPVDPVDSLAIGVASYLEPCTGEPTPTPTPTPTPLTSFQCQQIKLLRGGVEIKASDIKLGDTIVFRGFASATAIPKLRFTLTKGGVAQTPVDKDTTLVGSLYQADYQITADQATSYSVTAVAVAP